MTINPGEYFILTEGVYSEFQAITVCVALTEIDHEKLLEEYLALHPEQSIEHGYSSFKPYAFCKWLIVDKRVCRELDYLQWHLGNYGMAEFTVTADHVLDLRAEIEQQKLKDTKGDRHASS